MVSLHADPPQIQFSSKTSQIGIPSQHEVLNSVTWPWPVFQKKCRTPLVKGIINEQLFLSAHDVLKNLTCVLNVKYCGIIVRVPVSLGFLKFHAFSSDVRKSTSCI